MSVYLTFDQSTRPLIHAYIHPIEPTQDQWNAFMTEFDDLLNGDQPFAILFDLSHAKLVSMSMVHQFATFMKAHDEQFKQKIIASAVLSNNTLVRGILDILFTIRKPSKPNIVTKNSAKASSFLIDACREAGVIML